MKQEKVWDEIAPLWNEYKVEKAVRKTGLIDEFVEKKDKKVLDLGCGSGRNFFKIEGFDGIIYGVDFSKEMLKLAEKNAEKLDIKVELIRANVYDLPFENNFFDKVIFFATLHCIKGKEKRIKTLNELYRVLKPKGQALITVWNKSSKRWKNKSKEIKAGWAIKNKRVERYYYLYDYDELKGELESVGFKIVRHNFVESARNIILIVEK